MFKKLQQHWGVNSLQVILILITFALGGSLCGYLGRKLLSLVTIESKTLWVVIYILLVTILWPLCVLLISIPLGQFVFFKKYVGKLLRKIIASPPSPLQREKGDSKISGETLSDTNYKANIAIFASGGGSNAKKIIDYFVASKHITIALIASNKPNAGVLQIAKDNNIESLVIEKEQFFNGDAYISTLKKYNIDFIVLAGFLLKVPSLLITSYPKKIINIHPALLPKYGGKGMYGHFVHEAVIAGNETESGITIHYVDEFYDHGEIIFKATCQVDTTDTPQTLAKKIQALEHLHYPTVIESILPKQR